MDERCAKAAFSQRYVVILDEAGGADDLYVSFQMNLSNFYYYSYCRPMGIPNWCRSRIVHIL